MAAKRMSLTDAASLRALAHPLRLDILEQLMLHGPRTATQLGATLGESASNCSWHLRKLAAHGLVEEVPDVPGRSRPWRAVSEGISWGETDEDEETSAAGRGLTDLFLSRELHKLRASMEHERTEPAEWRDARTLTQSSVWMTAEETREAARELEGLLMRYVERNHDPALRPEGSRLVGMVGWVAPRADPRAPAPHDETTNHTDGTIEQGEER